MNQRFRRALLFLDAALAMAALAATAAFAVDSTSFKKVRSQSAVENNCLKNARADVDIRTFGGNQTMDVKLKHAPKNTGFTLFVIQQPNSPFGVSCTRDTWTPTTTATAKCASKVSLARRPSRSPLTA
jgi:hypothetical protein